MNSVRYEIEWLIHLLICWCQHRDVELCQLREGKPAQAAKDGQRDLCTILYVTRYRCNTVRRRLKHPSYAKATTGYLS